MHGSLLESTAWRGEKIQVQKVGGKGQRNRAYQAAQGLRCLASEFTLDLGSSQGALSVVEQRSGIMKAEFPKVTVTTSHGAHGRERTHSGVAADAGRDRGGRDWRGCLEENSGPGWKGRTGRESV